MRPFVQPGFYPHFYVLYFKTAGGYLGLFVCLLCWFSLPMFSLFLREFVFRLFDGLVLFVHGFFIRMFMCLPVRLFLFHHLIMSSLFALCIFFVRVRLFVGRSVHRIFVCLCPGIHVTSITVLFTLLCIPRDRRRNNDSHCPLVTSSARVFIHLSNLLFQTLLPSIRVRTSFVRLSKVQFKVHSTFTICPFVFLFC